MLLWLWGGSHKPSPAPRPQAQPLGARSPWQCSLPPSSPDLRESSPGWAHPAVLSGRNQSLESPLQSAACTGLHCGSAALRPTGAFPGSFSVALQLEWKKQKAWSGIQREHNRRVVTGGFSWDSHAEYKTKIEGFAMSAAAELWTSAGSEQPWGGWRRRNLWRSEVVLFKQIFLDKSIEIWSQLKRQGIFKTVKTEKIRL